MNFRFTPMTEQDLALMHRWINTPLLIDIWNDGKTVTLEEIRDKYLPRIDGTEPCQPYLILCDDVSIGYVQTYLWRDYPEYLPYLDTQEECSSLDVFIGEEAYQGRGIGPVMLRAFLREVVFAREGTESCIITPEVRNESALRAYEKAGFRRWRVVEPPFEPGPICLMRITRQEFFAAENLERYGG